MSDWGSLAASATTYEYDNLHQLVSVAYDNGTSIYFEYDAAGNRIRHVVGIDTDADGVPDSADNCPLIANSNQTDSDQDGIGDACDNLPDFDSDEDVDMEDFAIFQSCASAPGIPHDGSDTCQQADNDDDNDVDQDDFAIFQRCYSGENNPADPNCAD